MEVQEVHYQERIACPYELNSWSRIKTTQGIFSALQRTQKPFAYTVDVHSIITDEHIDITMVLKKHHWATLMFRMGGTFDPGAYFKAVLGCTQAQHDISWRAEKSKKLRVSFTEDNVEMRIILNRTYVTDTILNDLGVHKVKLAKEK